MAALDFLQNIPMKNELSIVESGTALMRRQMYGDSPYEESSESHYEEENEVIKEQEQVEAISNEDLANPDPNSNADGLSYAPGRKLHGKKAATIRIPLAFKYKMTKFSEQSAVVRQVLTLGFYEIPCNGCMDYLL